MPSISAVVLSYQKKKDGTYNVKYRITKNEKSAYISSPYYVIDRQLTDKFKIKDKDLLFQLDSDILGLRRKLLKLGDRLRFLSAKQISDYLKEDIENNPDIDFLLFLENEYKTLESKKKRNYENYKAVHSHLFTFTRGCLSFTQITPTLLSSFEKHLRKRGVGNMGINKYMSCIRATFNRGKDEYNDEDYGDIKIPNNPFSRYKVPKEGDSGMKDAGIEVVLDVYNYIPTNGLQELAKDMFFLSFYLMGMNAKDIHNDESKIKDGRLIYRRSKTKDKRSDNAEISIKLEPEVLSLMDKYKGLDKNIFNLSERYKSSSVFNNCISKGFRQIREKLGYDNLTFYSARHSWATIASHNCDIIDSHIAKCLNHVSIDFKVTNKYIKRDWSVLDKCNRQVLDFVAEKLKEEKEGA